MTLRVVQIGIINGLGIIFLLNSYSRIRKFFQHFAVLGTIKRKREMRELGLEADIFLPVLPLMSNFLSLPHVL